jgi:acyl carrier protein phosphodiesterase
MLDPAKWNVALIYLAEFVRNLPAMPDEDDAAHYHSIIKRFEDVNGEDLSRFRIIDDPLNRVARVTRDPFWDHWMTRNTKRNPFKPAYFFIIRFASLSNTCSPT